MLTTYKVKATKLKQGMQVEVESGNFKLMIDEPESFGGTDTAMNPMEIVLAALGGCQAIVASAYAKTHNVKFESFYVDVEGDIDLDGFRGKHDIKKGYQEIRYKMHFKTDEPKEKMERFAKFIEQTCPVTDTIQNHVRLVNSGIVLE